MNRDEGAYQLFPIYGTYMEPIYLYPEPVGRGDLDRGTSLAFLSFEKGGCQASKPSTIILYCFGYV